MGMTTITSSARGLAGEHGDDVLDIDRLPPWLASAGRRRSLCGDFRQSSRPARPLSGRWFPVDPLPVLGPRST